MADNPFLYLLDTQTGSKSVTTVITVGICIISLACNMSTFASGTRMTWAWARDGGRKFLSMSFFRLLVQHTKGENKRKKVTQ